jgi:ATP-dependent helicase/nuclease subunit A
VDGLRAAAAGFRDERLAAARLAVREGRTVEWEMPPANLGQPATDAVPAAVARVLAEDRPAWATQRSLAVTTVTQLVYFFRCPMVYYFDLVLQIDEHPRGRGKAGAVGKRKLSALDRGTHVHELLERADLTAEPKAEAARLVAQLTSIDASETGTIQSLLGNVLGDPLLDRARTATRLEREYRFYLDVGGTTVHGVIDLVFQDAEGRGVVVDYKSNDLAAPGRLQTLSELYRPQIELYALAAKQAGLVEPNEATLYFLNRATAVTTPLDDQRLDVVEAGVGDALGKIARGAWDTEPGEKCRGCGYRKRGYCETGKRFKE